MPTARKLTGIVAAAAMALAATGCGPSSSAGTASATNGRVQVVAAENEYGNVIAQIGGRFVSVYSVDSNPNTDPHTYEATPAVAEKIAVAKLLVENGLGYDPFMDQLASASRNASRRVIDVQHVLALPDDTPNPHLWYSPRTMPAVAAAAASDLAAIDPAHAAAFRANEKRFVASLRPWLDAIAAFKAKYAGTRAATTEPVADDLLQAMGIDNVTPFRFQADVMNGTDPSPQDISLERGLLTGHAAKVFCYNRQVVDALTTSIRETAIRAGVPVVGVYETMPVPGYDYQTWMVAETRAIRAAVAGGKSIEHL